MKVTVIEPDGTVREQDADGSLEWFQRAVGGPIEAVELAGTVVGYIHEEGKLVGLGRNGIATAVSKSSLFPGDWIAGPMVVAGFDPRSGLDRDLPAHWREHLRRLAAEQPTPVPTVTQGRLVVGGFPSGVAEHGGPDPVGLAL